MARSTCAGDCGLTFAGLSDFDKHHKVTTLGKQMQVVCLDPADLGMVHRDNDVWGTPVPTGVDQPKHWKAAEPSAPKVFDCADCGLPFENTPGRGRPPKRCTDCGGKGIPCDR